MRCSLFTLALLSIFGLTATSARPNDIVARQSGPMKRTPLPMPEPAKPAWVVAFENSRNQSTTNNTNPNQNGGNASSRNSGNVDGGNVTVDAGSGTITNTNGSGIYLTAHSTYFTKTLRVQVKAGLVETPLPATLLVATAVVQAVAATQILATQELPSVEMCAIQAGTLTTLVAQSGAEMEATVSAVMLAAEMPVVDKGT